MVIVSKLCTSPASYRCNGTNLPNAVLGTADRGRKRKRSPWGRSQPVPIGPIDVLPSSPRSLRHFTSTSISEHSLQTLLSSFLADNGKLANFRGPKALSTFRPILARHTGHGAAVEPCRALAVEAHRALAHPTAPHLVVRQRGRSAAPHGVLRRRWRLLTFTLHHASDDEPLRIRLIQLKPALRLRPLSDKSMAR
jgi:hypothetical protein